MLIAEAPNRSNIDKRVIGFPSASTASLSVCEAVIIAILFQNPASTANIFSSVSFHYSGEICDFTSQTKEGLSGDNTPGTISLHNNGRKVIDVEILQNDMPDQFSFGELYTFNFGTWIEHIIGIEEEIKIQNDFQVKSTGSQT